MPDNSHAVVTAPDTWRIGDRCWTYTHRGELIGPFRIMGIAEGYAMIRRPRAMPTVEHLNDLWVAD
jgi:hypothetical protein